MPKRRTQSWYDAHPNNAYWRKKALKVWGEIVLRRAGYVCELSGEQATDPHHMLTKGAWPNYAFDLSNGIALKSSLHTFHKGSAHGDPEEFINLLRSKCPDKWQWMQDARRENRPRGETCKEAYERLSEIALHESYSI